MDPESEYPGKLDFTKHNHDYEAVVTEVKSIPISSTSEVSTTIRGWPVDFKKDHAGNYTIAITVHDYGHAGCVGYLYSDGPFKYISGNNYTNIEAPGDLWTTGEPVSAHWIVIECNLH